MLDIYSASEKPIDGINSQTIVRKIKEKGHEDVIHVADHDEIIDALNSKKGYIDILVTQGAGSISKVCDTIINDV